MKIIRFVLKNLTIYSLLLQMHFILGLSAQTIKVRQDGSGDFSTIQQAVDSAANGDTVLVWPGVYFENVFIDQKAIVLGSLLLTTNDPDYANTTIIDGDYSRGCVYAYYCQDSVEINGFTLQHGSGTSLGPSTHRWGGGIFFYNSKGSAKNCIIKNNLVPGQGGGISILDSDVFLSGNLIKNNHVFESGGGVYILGSALFDSICLNDIYLNYAEQGCDIHIVSGHSQEPIHVSVDTFTVQNPDRYYILCNNGIVPNEDFTYSILQAKIETSNSDLFVSPDGDDANTGLSQDNPLKTVTFAMSKIVSDSLHPNTIHLANGIYSYNNGEKFPLNLRSYISLSGENRDSTILDASNVIYHMFGDFFTNNYSIKNITFKNGNGDVNSDSQFGSFILIRNYDLILENLLFTENTGDVGNCGPINISDNVKLYNVEFYHNYGAGKALRIGMGFGIEGIPNNKPDTLNITSCIFRGNKTGIDTLIALGGGASTIGSDVYDSSACVLTNCLFTGFISAPTSDIGNNAFSCHMGGEAYLVNCTFSDNHWNNINDNGAPVAVTYGSWLHIYNSILYGDSPAEIYLYTTDGFENFLDIYNSLLEGGIFGIKVYSPFNNIYYDPSNLDIYPKWDTIEPYKYSLLEGSPCIDAGTLDLPPGIELPEFDLAGNPRVWDESVDMGAYEYGPWVGVKEVGSRQPAVDSQLSVNPNPFTNGTNIGYKLWSSGKMNISVYSISGMKVGTLQDYQAFKGDESIFYWDGRDKSGNVLPAGVYLIRMTFDGQEVETVKALRE